MNIKLILLTVVTAFSIKSYSQNEIDSLLFKLEQSDNFKKVDILNRLSEAYRLENIEIAQSYALQASELSDSLNYSPGIGYATHNLGFMAYLSGDFNSAIEHNQKASDIADELNDLELKKRVYEILALIYEETDAYDRSLRYFQFSYDLNQAVNNPIGMGLSLMGAGRIYEKLKQFELALQRNIQSRNLFSNLRNKVGMAKSSIAVAKNYFYLDQHDSSTYYFHEAEELIEDLNSQEILLELFMAKNDAYSETYTDSSLFYVSKAIKLAEQLDQLYLKADLLLSTSELYSKRGDYQTAYDFHQRYSYLNDSLFNLQGQIGPDKLKVKINDAIYAEQESVFKNYINLSKNTASQNRLLVFGFGGIILFISTLLVWLVFRYNAQKKSIGKVDVLQEEITALSAELTKKDEVILNLREKNGNSIKDPENEIIENGFDETNVEREHKEMSRVDYITNSFEAFISKQWSNLHAVVKELNYDVKGFSIEDIDQENWDQVDLNVLILLLIRSVHESLAGKIRIHYISTPGMVLQCQKESMLFMFSCLLQNAIESIKDEGDIYVDFFSDEEKITYRMIDTGTGIILDNRSKIFEPFFSTKKQDDHIGLGLTVSQEILKKHEAVISIKSKPDTATEVMLEFYYT